MRCVDLFSGCGGLSLGLAGAGFKHEVCLDWNADAVETLRANQNASNLVPGDILHADIRNIDWSFLPAGIDLVAGGPPCQPFSIGGKSLGQRDERDMWPHAISAVREIMPKAFLFENVRGLTRPAFADYLSWIVNSLSHVTREGLQGKISDSDRVYTVKVFKLNAADFGAAQTRHRVIIAGIRRDIAEYLQPLEETHSLERLLWDQWCEGTYWERHAIPRPDDAFIPSQHRRAVERLRADNRRPRLKPWVTVRDRLKDLGHPDGTGNHIFQKGARAYPGHTGSPMDLPAKALKAGAHGVPGGENMMVGDDGAVRYFTIREAARLQGFPDSYSFSCSWSEAMRQLGNAVPVELGERLGEWAHRHLKSKPTD